MEEGHGSVGVDHRQPGKEGGCRGGGDGDPSVDKIQLENGERPTVPQSRLCVCVLLSGKVLIPMSIHYSLTDIIMGQSQRISGHRLGDLSTERSSIPLTSRSRACEHASTSTYASLAVVDGTRWAIALRGTGKA